MTVDPTTIDKAFAAIEKSYGKDMVHFGVDETPFTRISTGSLELDYATGGGIPMGRIAHFWGGYSAGKSLTAWQTIKSAQRAGLEAAYYNIEKQFDPLFTKSLGVDTSKLHVIEAGTIEECGTILEALLSSVHVHVIDSLAAAPSIDELGAKVEDWQIGLQARAWGKVLRRTGERLDRHENLVVMINHARDNFRGGENAPMGRFVEHMSSCTIHFRRGGWLFYDANGYLSPDNKSGTGPTMSGDQEADGYEIIARVEKSRAGRPLRTARMRYDFASREIDHAYELAKAAKYTGVVAETSPGRFELKDGTKLHGMKRLREAIEADAALADLVKSTLLATA